MTDEEFENMQGLVADGLIQAVLSDDWQSTRIIFQQDQNKFYFEVSTAELAAFMPLLAKAANAAHSKDTRTAIAVVEAAAATDGKGGAIVSFVGTAGAEMAFSLPTPIAHKLSDELQSALLSQGPPKASH